jgi:2,3-diketo-5-methylthiopentyl-1-phosphate enolase
VSGKGRSGPSVPVQLDRRINEALTSTKTPVKLSGLMVATYTNRPDLIQVTYKVLSEKLLDPEKKAKEIALSQTTDAWTPTDPSAQKKLLRYQGLVLGIDERTHVPGRPYEYYLTVGFPPDNTEGDIPTLLTMIFGRLSTEGTIRLEALRLPDNYFNGKGPAFGIEGIREKVGEPEKPLLLAQFKPPIGLTPAAIGQHFYELACGGMHLVSDPENLPDMSISPTEERLAECLKAGERAKAETGQLTLYAVNLTGPSSKIVARAKKLSKQGAQCFLFNALSYGYGLLEELKEVGVPILVHSALAGALSGAQDTGMSYAVVLGTLPRLAGADMTLFPSRYSPFPPSQQEAQAIRDRLTWNDVPILKSFPVPSFGINPTLVPEMLQEHGKNVILNAGDSVYSHPKGARAGAKSYRQAIHWTLKRGNFGSLAHREFPELSDALRFWRKK